MSSAAPPTTSSTKIASAAYITSTSLPSVTRMPRPLPADRRRDGRHHADRREPHHVAGELEHHLRDGCRAGRRPACPCSPIAASATPKNVANTTTCRMSPFAIASTTEVGNRCSRMSQPAAAGSAPCAASSLRVGADRQRHAGARLEHVDHHQADHQRDGRRQLEPDDRLEADPPHRLADRRVPAMPTTSVEKSSGAMIILIIRRNRSASGLMATPNAGHR